MGFGLSPSATTQTPGQRTLCSSLPALTANRTASSARSRLSTASTATKNKRRRVFSLETISRKETADALTLSAVSFFYALTPQLFFSLRPMLESSRANSFHAHPREKFLVDHRRFAGSSRLSRLS